MEMDRNPGWASAPYGRACAGCAQAKCKCLVAEPGESCARCRRLNRECRPASRTRKTNPLRRSIAAKTAQLERRLDELTSFLQSTGQPRPIRATSGSVGTESGVSSVSQPSVPSKSSALSSSAGTAPPSASPGGPVADSSDATDEEILNHFRSERLPFLPFIYVQPKISAAEFQKESPFLWRAITILHCKDTLQRDVLHLEFKETAAHELLVGCRRSFDLLQSLLVYIAWISFESQQRKVSLGPYMQMAIGLVLDIELHKPPSQTSDLPPSQCTNVDPGLCRPWVSLVRTMSERRAMVGCFLLCSVVSHTLRRSNTLRWTPHMKECLDVLEEAKEAPNDALLVQLVRTQLFVDKVNRELGYDCDVDDKDRLRAPLSFYIKGFQSQLEDIQTQTPPSLSQNKPLLLHLYYAETVLHETALMRPVSTNNEVDIVRLDQLYACLNTIQKRFEVLLSLPASAFAFYPSSILFPTAHILTTLLRLSTFKYPGWDWTVVRQTADLLSLTQQVADKFSRAAAAVGIQSPGGDTDTFSSIAKILSGLRARWASTLPEQQTNTTAVPPVEVPLLPELDLPLIDTWLAAAQNYAWVGDSSWWSCNNNSTPNSL